MLKLRAIVAPLLAMSLSAAVPRVALEATGETLDEVFSDFALTTDDASPLTPAQRFEQFGVASWYGGRHHGRKTASGAIFDMEKLTAAHRSLPLGTAVRVTNLANGRSVDVMINDRGPYIHGRVIDLSRRAASDLAMVESGLAAVRIEVLSAMQMSEMTQRNFN